MSGVRWVNLPKSKTHRAFVARLALALDTADRPDGGSDVDVRFHGEPLNRTKASRLLVIGPDDAGSMLEAVENGAAGYVPMSRGIDTLASAVADVSSGRAVIPDEMLGALLRQVVQSRRETPASTQPLDGLTNRELEVFQLAARGLDKFAIGDRLGISQATARTHLANIMAKMDLRSRAELVAAAAAMGIDTRPLDD